MLHSLQGVCASGPEYLAGKGDGTIHRCACRGLAAATCAVGSAGFDRAHAEADMLVNRNSKFDVSPLGSRSGLSVEN